MRYGTYVRFSLLPCSSLISLLSNKLLCFSIQLQTSESPISSTSYYASMSSSPTIYNMDFSFGSPYSGRAENSAGPATIKVSSLDDMCKSGGITVIILMVIVVGVLVLLYLLCHGFKGTKKQSSFRRYFSVLYRSIVGVASNNATSTSLLYNKEDGNLSTFRRVIMVPLEKVFVKPMVPGYWDLHVFFYHHHSHGCHAVL